MDTLWNISRSAWKGSWKQGEDMDCQYGNFLIFVSEKNLILIEYHKKD